jgi:ABC-type multidrug transport system fused ATPase/permease subunit
VKNQVWKQAWAIFGPLKWRILVVLSLIAVAQALHLVWPAILGMIIENLRQQKELFETYKLLAFAGAVMLVNHWLGGFTRECYEVEKVDFDIEESAHDRTMQSVTSLSIGQHNSLHSGLKQSIVSRGQHSMTTLVNMLIYEIIPTALLSLIFVGALCWVNRSIGLMIAGIMVLFCGITFWTNQHFKHDLKRLERMWNQEARFRNEILQHITHVMANAQEKRAMNEPDAKYEEAVAVAKPLWLRFHIIGYCKTMLFIFGRLGVAALGAHYVFTGQHTLGEIVTLLFWSNSALERMWNLGNIHRQIITLWSSILRYCEFLNLESDIKISENPVVLNPLIGKIEIKKVSFQYGKRIAFVTRADEDEDYNIEDGEKSETVNSRRNALEEVSLDIKPGETVALVGKSGSGKTTVAGLLAREYDPTEGEILIDGHDLKTLDLANYRAKVGVVKQKVPLWDQSIRYNILYGANGKAQNITEEELGRIADISRISAYSHKLQHGLDTMIGERGIKLSGGEQQRVGIACALAKNPSILILDEATSNLDAGVEAEIRDAINEASKGRTTIIIAHRFSTIRYAGRIIVMDEGRIVGDGKHQDLYRTCEIYRDLVDHQICDILQENSN